MNLERHIDKATAAFTAAYGKVDAWRTEKAEALEKYHKDALRLTKEAAVEENARLVTQVGEKMKAALIDKNILAEANENAKTVVADLLSATVQSIDPAFTVVVVQ